MKFTGQEEYGLRCILQVARHQGAEPLTISQIAESEGLSVPYVAKLMALLRKADLVEGVRGRNGGYVLKRSPEEISVADVLAVLGDHLYEEELCDKWTGEMNTCVHNTDCAIRSMWKALERLVVDATDRIKLAQLVRIDEDAVAGVLENQWDQAADDPFKIIPTSSA